MKPLADDCIDWIIGKRIRCMPDAYLHEIGFIEHPDAYYKGTLKHPLWDIHIPPPMRSGSGLHIVEGIKKMPDGKHLLYTGEWYWMPEFTALAEADALIICKDD